PDDVGAPDDAVRINPLADDQIAPHDVGPPHEVGAPHDVVGVEVYRTRPDDVGPPDDVRTPDDVVRRDHAAAQDLVPVDDALRPEVRRAADDGDWSRVPEPRRTGGFRRVDPRRELDRARGVDLARALRQVVCAGNGDRAVFENRL